MTEPTPVTLYGGPLDGMELPLLLDPDDDDPGVAMISDWGIYEGGRSWYEPDADGVWRWVGDSP